MSLSSPSTATATPQKNTESTTITTTTTTTTTTTHQQQEEEEEAVVRRRQALLLTGPLRGVPASDGVASINVSICNGVYLVWSPDEAFALRARFRIVGALIGALPFAAQQNDTASLPLALSYEELALLHRLGCVRLHAVPRSPARFDAAARAAYYERRKAIEQLRFSLALLTRRVLELKHRAAAGAASKKRKQPTPAAAAAESSEPQAATGVFTASLADVEDADGKLAANAVVLDQLHADYAAYAPLDGDDSDGASAAATADGVPTDELPPIPDSTTAAHCAVFADLWQRGFFLTSASKFGGDFLAYHGDPLKYHASFVVVVSRSDEPLLLCEIAALGRLANAVKKTGLVASLDADQVSYLTIDWRSMTK